METNQVSFTVHVTTMGRTMSTVFVTAAGATGISELKQFFLALENPVW